MNTLIEHADWDSNFLHLKTGIINIPMDVFVTNDMLSEIKKKAKEQSYSVLYLKLLNDSKIDESVLETFNDNISWVDRKMTYTKTIHSSTPSSCSSIKSFNSTEIPDELYYLATESGKHSRFKNDTHFPKGTFELLYKTWIERSVNREIADDVLVHYENNRINGFLTYKINEASCTIGLVAISPNHQKQGIGSKLINCLEQKSLIQGIYTLEVATQSENTQACAFYEKNEFQISDITNIYHLWL
ncbi:GNAT family N-acetyltransferase [Bacteroides sp.]